jgi:SAM-dependent methyltransferase/UDP-N-acetylglucosamine transferase subunit ALG13
VFVTVGMGRWPFDRLLRAVGPLCADHDVFVQRGPSTVDVPCESVPYLDLETTRGRLATADVVVTHGGNTVRLVQRLGKVPIAVAREAARGEMANDHQVQFLRREVDRGRVVVLNGDLAGLAAAVSAHPDVEPRLLRDGAALPSPPDERVVSLLDSVVSGAGRRDGQGRHGALGRHPLRRYAWAYSMLADREGPHLELGIGDGTFAATLDATTRLDVVCVDPHPGYVVSLRRRPPSIPVVRSSGLPCAAGSFASATALDVLEHVESEARTLDELHRVLRPGGLLLVSVPARHAFSTLDPDNAKLRLPRVHRAVYRTRYGAAAYDARFVDSSDGLRGDLAWSRREHTNYRADELLALLDRSGFTPVRRDGANLFWRFLQVPQLLAPPGVARLLDAPLRLDGELFHRANLFVAATRDE